MKHANIPARLALEFVRSRRPIVNPNKAFMAQLTVWGECGYDTALLMPDMTLPEGVEEQDGEEGDGPSEEEMLQMALEMSLAASEPESEGAEALGGRLVVVNPDRVPDAVVVVEREVEMVEAEAGTNETTGAGPNGAGDTTVIPAILTPHTAPQTQLDIDIDIDMTPPPNPNPNPTLAAHPHPQSQEPTTPELLSQYDVLTKPTPADLHPEARIQRAAEEEWVLVTMEEGMRKCFEECVRHVGGRG